MRHGLVGLVVGVVVCKLALAAHLGLLADEAYYWAWSRRLALGYYDHPPLLAWVIALGRAVGGDHALAIRAIPVLAWGCAVWALAIRARHPESWLWWALATPGLAVLTSLAVPDSLLLACWAGALAAAIKGGRGWWLAGLLGGLCSLSKLSGLAVVPLLVASADAAERRTVHPWVGVCIALLCAAPNLAWNAEHGFVTLRFQLAHGLGGTGGLDPVRLIRFCLEQVLIVGPFVAMAAGGWLWSMGESVWRGRSLDRIDRIDRLCFGTSVPLLVGFALASLAARPEANWPAPAWIGLGLGLSRASGRVHRLFSLGAVGWGLLGLLFSVHLVYPLVSIGKDPAARFTEGAHLADEVGRFVIPAAYGDVPKRAVFTERYQEAALLSWYGIEASVLAGCGRRSQYDLWAEQDAVPLPASAWFVRPRTHGPPDCALDRYDVTVRPHVLGTVDSEGRRMGPWDLIELSALP